MKSQKHNQGEVKSLSVNIETPVVDTMNAMSQCTGIKVDELVVIALKRYISSHTDFLPLGQRPYETRPTEAKKEKAANTPNTASTKK